MRKQEKSLYDILIDFANAEGIDEAALTLFDNAQRSLGACPRCIAQHKNGTFPKSTFFNEPEKKFVNISASGIRFTIDYAVKEGEIMDIKLLLPTYPPVAVFAYGEVKRAIPLEDGKYDIALEYINMSDSVKNEIIQYAFAQQRDSIRKIKDTVNNE